MKLSLKREARYNPRSPRTVISIPSALLLPDDREIFIHIRNMSVGGFMAVTDEELAAGTWLGVNIPGRGIVRAEVRWFEDGMLGAKFERPLTLQEVEAF